MEVNAKDKSRRRILKGLAAGTAVASIPAKSVWANTVTTSIVASGQGSSNLLRSVLLYFLQVTTKTIVAGQVTKVSITFLAAI